ncbi:hypothetical protein D3C72_1551330 [compost metagenome]
MQRGLGSRCGDGGGRLGAGSHGAEHVALGHAAVLARAGHVAGLQVVVRQQLGSGGHGHVGLRTTGGGGCRCGSSSGRRGGGCSCCSGRRGGGLAVGVDLGDQLVGHHGGAVGLNDLDQHAGRGCRHFEHDLVGFDLDQDFIDGDGFAGFLLPREHGGLGHGFGKLGDFDFYDRHLE